MASFDDIPAEDDVAMYSDDGQDFSEDAVATKKMNWKGSIYDDDEFEKSVQENINCDYGAIMKSRRTKLIQSNLTNKNNEAKKILFGGEKDEEEEKPKAPPKTWGNISKVEAVKISNDFPNLASVKIVPPTNPQRFSEVQTHQPKKWKKITHAIFNEESPTTEPVVAREQSQFASREQSQFVQRNEFTVVQPRRSPQEHQRLLSTQPKSADIKKSPEASSSSGGGLYKNTKMCSFGENCKKRGKGCNYAHTLDEFSPVECRFQGNCKNRSTCGFKHGDESKEDFLTRTKK